MARASASQSAGYVDHYRDTIPLNEERYAPSTCATFACVGRERPNADAQRPNSTCRLQEVLDIGVETAHRLALREEAQGWG